MVITDFDGIFPHIGGFGRYQLVLFSVNCLVTVYFGFNYLGQIFMSLTPPHWCQAPPGMGEALNLTAEELKNLTIPQKDDDFHQCVRYDVNFTQAYDGHVITANPAWPTIPCDYGWHYNYSLYYPTITSQLNWVCEEDWKPTLAQSLFYVGSLVGSPLFGWLADTHGRIPAIILTNMVGGVMGVASAFSNSFVSFVVMRFIVGMTHDSQFMICYILLLEYVSSKYRTIMANVPILTFLTASMCMMPWIAWALADWSKFAIIIHVSQLVSISFYWLIPESARWLLSQGRVEDAVKILQKAAKVNGKVLSPQAVQEFRDYGKQVAMQAKLTPNVSCLDLLKTPVLRKRFLVLCVMWFVITLAYDVHMRNTENIGSDIFTSFTLAGLVEMPADFLTMFLVEYLGRRHTTVCSLILSGVACLLVIGLESSNTIGILLTALAGRFLITMSINVGQMYPVEVLPTVARVQGSGSIHTLGYIAAFMCPYVVYLSRYGHWLPYIVTGIVTIIGGVVCILLPETLNEPLPDSLEDGEKFCANQSLFYNPCDRLYSVSNWEES